MSLIRAKMRLMKKQKREKTNEEFLII